MSAVSPISTLTILLLFSSVKSQAQGVGNCEHGTAAETLDINGVSAALYNNGNLFWNGRGPHYNVPAGTPANAIFAANVWVGGLVDGELRFSGSLYGPWEMWPGPIDDATGPPVDCSVYDRFWKVDGRDIGDLDATGVATDDIRDWPWQLGAPVEDGDGNPDNYDLKAGDRPAIEGDQTVWWVMNDQAGPHERFRTDPLGLEVRVLASGFGTSTEDLHYTTFYRYTLVNRSGRDIDSMYFGMYVDPDLGDAGDDYVGSDSLLGVGYTYNGDDFDGGSAGYGDQPPAVGITVVEGPPMSHFVYFNGDSCVQCFPQTAQHAYQYMKSLWIDSVPITYGGTGRGFSDIPASFMFSGRPPAYWSEESTIGQGIRNTPADRRFAWSAGPFQLKAGASQDIVLAIIWAQGVDRFASVDKLLETVPVVKQAYAEGPILVEHPVPNSSPKLLSPADGVGDQPSRLTLEWEDVAFADRYELEITADTGLVLRDDFRTRNWPEPVAQGPISRDVELTINADYRWRVRPSNPSRYGPWSAARSFTTGSKTLNAPGPLPIVYGSADPAFIQVQGIGDDDACGPNAGSTYGCAEVGGNFVYASFNGQGDWVMYYQGSGPEATVGAFAPHDFEIRVTDEGSYGYFLFSSGNVVRVPFEVWDIGDVGPFGVNDTTDDIQLIPVIFSDDGGECFFGFGEGEDPFGLGWQITDRVYAYYSRTSYNQFEAAVRPLVESHPDGCPTSPDTDPAGTLVMSEIGRPLQRLIFMMDPTDPDYRPEMIPVGNVIRFLTSTIEPPQPSAPAPGATVSSEVTLFWQLPPNADTSRVQISTAADFSTILLDKRTAAKSLHVENLERGNHYWRVSYGGEEWSDVWDFVVVPGTSAEDDGFGLPTALELKPPYPNPSDGPRSLVYGVPGQQRVSLAVYDLLGRRVEEISDRDQTAGWHTETWDPKALSAGVYFVILESQAARKTQPVVVAR